MTTVMMTIMIVVMMMIVIGGVDDDDGGVDDDDDGSALLDTSFVLGETVGHPFIEASGHPIHYFEKRKERKLFFYI